MKLEEKKLAIKLRKKGYSINEICQKANLAKGSVSVWVRNVELTKEQKEKLSEKGIKKEVIEKRRMTRLTRESAKRSVVIRKAEKDIKKISKKELFLIGTTFYWAEGRKSAKGIVGFTNSDPRAIKLMMRFFQEIYKVGKKKFRAHIHIHPHLNVTRAEKYWSDVSGIPLKQFYKTYRKPNKSSQGKKDTLPYGTLDIYIFNTELLLKIQGWINGICKGLKV